MAPFSIITTVNDPLRARNVTTGYVETSDIRAPISPLTSHVHVSTPSSSEDLDTSGSQEPTSTSTIPLIAPAEAQYIYIDPTKTKTPSPYPSASVTGSANASTSPENSNITCDKTVTWDPTLSDCCFASRNCTGDTIFSILGIALLVIVGLLALISCRGYMARSQGQAQGSGSDSDLNLNLNLDEGRAATRTTRAAQGQRQGERGGQRHGQGRHGNGNGNARRDARLPRGVEVPKGFDARYMRRLPEVNGGKRGATVNAVHLSDVLDVRYMESIRLYRYYGDTLCRGRSRGGMRREAGGAHGIAREDHVNVNVEGGETISAVEEGDKDMDGSEDAVSFHGFIDKPLDRY